MSVPFFNILFSENKFYRVVLVFRSMGGSCGTQNIKEKLELIVTNYSMTISIINQLCTANTR